jgi:Vacuolar protein sorting-associated protein 26
VFHPLQNFLGFGQSAEIDIVFNDIENRKYAECRMDESGKKEKLLLYYDGESISGKVSRWFQCRTASDRAVTQLSFFSPSM